LVPPEKMELRIGDTHTIRLAGLGTVGYEWNYNVEGDEDVIEVSQRSAQEDYNGNNIDPEESNKKFPPGQSIDEIFIIRGIKSGRATVHLVQRRPWEIDVLPLNKADVEVIVLGK
jgi:predicted secreted protein